VTQKPTLPDEIAAKRRSCLAHALRLLGKRALSDQALGDALAQEQYDPADISAALAQIRTWGYINDARLGESVVATAQRQKKGPAWLQQQLKRRQLPADVVTSSLATLRQDSGQMAQDILTRRFGAQQLAEARTAMRAMRLLQRRGFDLDVIYKAIKAVKSGPSAQGQSEADGDHREDFIEDPDF
jgi:regulatory protein